MSGSESVREIRPLWRFRCEADELPNGTYRVRLVSDTGIVRERVGYHPLWELIRMLGERGQESDERLGARA